jgi:hypothetical protein
MSVRNEPGLLVKDASMHALLATDVNGIDDRLPPTVRDLIDANLRRFAASTIACSRCRRAGGRVET